MGRGAPQDARLICARPLRDSCRIGCYAIDYIGHRIEPVLN
jgi:hypothetical protein